MTRQDDRGCVGEGSEVPEPQPRRRGALSASQVSPERRLIAAIIHQAVLDVAERPLTDDRGRAVRIHPHAASALDFLWSDAAESYCQWLEIDIEFIRRKLLEGSLWAGNQRARRAAAWNAQRFAEVRNGW